MMYVYIIIVLLLVIGLAVLLRPRRKQLSSAAKARIQSHWKTALSLQDPHRRILEADKVLDQLLKELGYTGSLGEKLKKAAKIIPDLNSVWRAHKLRNTIAHEPGVELRDRDVREAMDAFGKVVGKFL